MTSCPSVRLPLLKALSSSQCSGAVGGAGGDGGGGSSGSGSVWTQEERCDSRSDQAARLIGRWWRNAVATGVGKFSPRQKDRASSPGGSCRKRRRVAAAGGHHAAVGAGNGNKRLKSGQQKRAVVAERAPDPPTAAGAPASGYSAASVTKNVVGVAKSNIQSSASLASPPSSSLPSARPRQPHVAVRLLQSSPSAEERRDAAEWLLRSVRDERAAVCLKRELRNLLEQLHHHHHQQQQQQHVLEWMAVWKGLLTMDVTRAAAAVDGSGKADAVDAVGPPGTAGRCGDSIASGDSRRTLLVGACYDDYAFVSRQLLFFVASNQLVAAAACADWCRHVVLLAASAAPTTAATETAAADAATTATAAAATTSVGTGANAPAVEEEDAGATTAENKGGASREKTNSGSEKHRKVGSASGAPISSMSIAQLRNRHWLWRDLGSSTATSNNNMAGNIGGSTHQQLSQVSTASSGVSVVASTPAKAAAAFPTSASCATLSPLACLVAAHYALQDTNATAGLRAGDVLRTLLQTLVDPNQGVTKYRVNSSESSSTAKMDGKDAATATKGGTSTGSTTRKAGNDRSSSSNTRQGESEAAAATSPPNRLRHGHRRSVLESLEENTGDEDEDLESDDDDDSLDDDDEEQGTPHEDTEEDDERQNPQQRQRRQHSHQQQEDDEDYLPDLEPVATKDDDDDDDDENGNHDEGEGDDHDEEEGDHEECDSDDDDDDDGDDDDPMEIELSELEQAVAESSDPSSSLSRNKSVTSTNGNAVPLNPPLEQRKRLLVLASVQVLEAHHPHYHHSLSFSRQQQHQQHHKHHRRPNLLTLYSESALIEGINTIIKPPKKLVSTKIILRRAPTQEEFFRGSLSRNPITLQQLRQQRNQQQGEHDVSSYEPTVDDLRRHIARDLQMQDSAELLEILVANQILDPSLKLRVVHQVVWRNHLMENHPNTASGSSLSSLVSHSGLAMIFSSGLTERLVSHSSSGRLITAETPVENLPALVATYRLAGVDGEATEDTVTTLVDPEAPVEASTPEEQEARLEEEYGLTRLVTAGRGIPILLRSIQHSIGDSIRRIRRDGVDNALAAGNENLSLRAFTQQPPCAGLVLLRHASQLSSNRKLLLSARAPTVLLKLLLDVLKVLEGDSSGDGSASKKNATAEILQELIEILSSDISTSSNDPTSTTTEEEYESDTTGDASSLPILLDAIETVSLSPPLRHVIAKLLPFLTQGQQGYSRTLANHFDRNISMDLLGLFEEEGQRHDENTSRDQRKDKACILMNTFVTTAIHLPPNHVCDSLRVELVHIGFIERLVRFVSGELPPNPPPWSPALWDKAAAFTNLGTATGNKKKRTRRGNSSSSNSAINKAALEEAWRKFFSRCGVRTAIKILTGLCKGHVPTQSRIANTNADFIRCCHWLESTSDNAAAKISTEGLGLLAEELLDEMLEGGNVDVVKLIKMTRDKTRQRKRELAEERRKQALLKMGNFRPQASAAAPSEAAAGQQSSSSSNTVRGAAASIFAPVLGLFSTSNNPAESSSTGAASSRSGRGKDKDSKPAASDKPAWLAEMEAMEDDVGLTCAVCQEGRTLQPSELLGLYAYVKRVSIPFDQCGSRAGIEGSALLRGLPPTIPDVLVGDPIAAEWYLVGKAAAENLSSDSVSSSRRTTVFTTTVSACNAIHFSCHRTARQADRNHPKAPKSEWEGAHLRNNRVSCNVILPLVSSRSSQVSMMAVETGLTEHTACVSNLLGSTPRSMLWHVLHDVRLLLLRMAYGEALNADCGGGSLASNCQLLYYQLLLADMFDKDAQVDQPAFSQHARGLPSAFLAACSMVSNETSGNDLPSSLVRGIADSAPMAALNSIVFHNAQQSQGSSEPADKPHPKRMWVLGADFFLRGFLICGGRRHALGLEGSGCQTSRRRALSTSMSEWEIVEDSDLREVMPGRSVLTRSSSGNRTAGSGRRQASNVSIDDFQMALRPFITMFAIMDQLSSDFTPNMEDVQIEESAERLVHVIEACRHTRNIHELLEKAKVTLAHNEIIDLIQKGMMAA